MSFNTSNIQADTLTAVYNVTAPKHTVGTVELTQDGDNLSVIGVNSEIVNTDDVVASVSVSTPLLTSPSLFPMTVQNLKKVELSSGSGSVGQVLALDASGNLVWADDANTPQGLASVLGVSDDAGGLNITNLLKLTPVSGAGTKDQVLSCDASGNLDWITPVKETPTLSAVLAESNDAGGQNIVNVGSVEAVSLKLTDTAEWNFAPNSANNNLEISSVQNGYIDLISSSLVTTGQIKANLLIGKKPSFDYWVSPNGSDIDAVNNGGSLENPFQTINACINYCETLTAVDNEYRYIHVLGGTYNENFLLISKKVYIQGEAVTSQSASVGCQINATIVVQVNANGADMFNNAVHFSGLLINGSISNQSGENHMLILENVYIYTPNDTNGRGLYHNPSAVNSRLKLWNCQIISGGSNGTLPLLESTSVGQVSMNYCYLSAKGNQTCLLLAQTATCDSINNCKFENSNSAGLTAQPIVKITANVSATYTFSNCAFVYTNPSDKTANPNASGILNQNNAGNNTIIALYNTFILTGTNTSNNYAIQDFNHSTLIQMICLYYMNGATPSNAFAIHGTNNQNKFQLQVVS